MIASVVALRKESVDRNLPDHVCLVALYMSLSARRAWIEITRRTYHKDESQVALRKESVDRNKISENLTDRKRRSLSARRAWIEIDSDFSAPATSMSLSARRAWIEIMNLIWTGFWRRVALRKESVDRNCGCLLCAALDAGRSPQGERG